MPSLHRHRPLRFAGVTLVELIIVIGILAGISGLVGSFQAGVFRMNRTFSSGINIVVDANRVVRRMTADVRPLTQSSLGSFPIETLATSTFAFFVDLDGDTYRERIRYYLDGSTLMRGVTIPGGTPPTYSYASETATVLMKNVRNDAATHVFSYYNRSYAGTSTPLTYPIPLSAVRHLRVTIVADEDPLLPPAPVTVRTATTFRNLKDNL